MTLILSAEQNSAIRDHAARDYPGECCGVLIGDTVGGGNYVSSVIPIANRHEEGAARRFRITSDDLLQVEKIARKQNRSIIGFYHSHPDVPAVPSAYDQSHAWEEYSYLIIQVDASEPVSARSWKLDLDAGRFNEENVLVSQCVLELAAESASDRDDND